TVAARFGRLSRVVAIFGRHRWCGLPVELERLDRSEGVLVAAAPFRAEPGVPRQRPRAPKRLQQARDGAFTEPGLLRKRGAGWEDPLAPGVVPVDVRPQDRGRGVDGAVRVVHGFEEVRRQWGEPVAAPGRARALRRFVWGHVRYAHAGTLFAGGSIDWRVAAR